MRCSNVRASWAVDVSPEKTVSLPRITRKRIPIASLAGMAVSHGIARGIFAGLFARPAVFQVTTKAWGGKQSRRQSGSATIFGQVREETFLFVGLMVCLTGLALSGQTHHPESLVWMALLALQSVPYIAAIICAGLSAAPEGRIEQALSQNDQIDRSSLGTRVITAPSGTQHRMSHSDAVLIHAKPEYLGASLRQGSRQRLSDNQ